MPCPTAVSHLCGRLLLIGTRRQEERAFERCEREHEALMRQYDADFERRSIVQRAQELLAAARKRPSRMSAIPVVVNRKRKICESSSEDEVRRTYVAPCACVAHIRPLGC